VRSDPVTSGQVNNVSTQSSSHVATNNATARIAETAATLRLDSLPSHVIERAKDLVLDHLGVTLYGTLLPWSQHVRAIVISEGGAKESSLYGGDHGVPARAAALANGAAAHAIEFDDTHDESLNHPGAVIMPTAIAMAEALERSGSELIAAIVAGYETQCRIGSALGSDLIRYGFHPTATCGVFGSAAAAGSLLRLDTAKMIGALGLCGSMSSGSMQFSEDPLGTMIKRLHAGLPAERGVLAAKLSANGFTGPRNAIEGQWGFARAFARQEQLDRITLGLGEQFEIERITVKLYPCCKMFHSLIEAIETCQREHEFEADDIARIEPFGPRNMMDTHMEYRPQSTMSAQYSLPYACAAAIVLNPSDPDAYNEKARALESVRKIMDLVEPSVSDELEAMFPRRFAAGVRITLRSGKVLAHTVLDARSSPDVPIGREEIQSKFRTLTSAMLSPDEQQRMIDLVVNLDQMSSIRELRHLLRSAACPNSTGTFGN